MTLLAPPASRLPLRRRLAKAALLTAAAVAAATALVDLLAPPSPGDHLTTMADYAFTAMLFPFVLAPLAAVTLLHRIQDGQDGRLGAAGYLVTSAALIAFIPCGIASLATGNARALGPVYMLSMLGSLAGLTLFAISSARAGVLPRWAGPALVIGWLSGGPIAEGGSPGFRGAAVILAATFTAIAIALPRTDT